MARRGAALLALLLALCATCAAAETAPVRVRFDVQLQGDAPREASFTVEVRAARLPHAPLRARAWRQQQQRMPPPPSQTTLCRRSACLVRDRCTRNGPRWAQRASWSSVRAPCRRLLQHPARRR